MANERALLVINSGSSSLKFGLYRLGGAEPERLARGRIEALHATPRFAARGADGASLGEAELPQGSDPYDAALTHVLTWLKDRFPRVELAGAGHRIVHGGRDYADPVRLGPEDLARLEGLSPLAPLHQPQNLSPIRALAALRPELPQIGCFDTAFHRTNPRIAQLFGLPRAFAEEGILRYGFHGLSYAFVSARLSELDPALASGRVIVAHLGSGASLCALSGGRSVASTMGFTALDGLPMGTRSGTLDPGVLLYLLQARGYDAARLEHLLYAESGLRGLSGLSGDMEVLLASGDPGAEEAIAYFCYRAVREAGSLAAALGGVDGVVFTAGIGENAPRIRARIAEGLAWLGAELDPAANEAQADVISTPASKIRLRIIPTNEELVIARAAAGLVGEEQGANSE
ncbi:MAG: acetate/propionate family kinase [Alphaproteobacteria bacterium]|nr:acetate/propionate family kinase [Alphaproteobacteria bacterium]